MGDTAALLRDERLQIYTRIGSQKSAVTRYMVIICPAAKLKKYLGSLV